MEHEFSPTFYYHLKMEEGVTKEKLNAFCGDSNYFLRLPKLLREFVQQDQENGSYQAVYCLNIFKSP